MKVGTPVRIVDHEGYENILRVGDVGEAVSITEEIVSVKFDGSEEAVEYPQDCVRELTEEEQQQLGSGGKSGMPDTSKPTPPQMDKDEVALKGEQKQVAQGDSPESHASGGDGQSAGVSSDTVELDGEQKHPEKVSGGTSSASRPDTESGSQTAGVKGDQVVVKGEQKQASGVPAREVVKGVKESRLFRPVGITVLEQGEGEDEYVAIGEGASIRNERHLIAGIKSAVHKAMESMDRPFDSVQIVFRRDPIAES